MKRLDPRSPLVVDTTELSRRPGSMRTLSRTVEFPDNVGTEVIVVPAGSPVDVEMRLESVMEGVLVSGSAEALAAGLCVRCLEPLTDTVSAPFQELFVHADRAALYREVGATEEDTEEYVLVDDLFDLEPVLVDALVPALPFQPVCRADCPGLCVECGQALADDPGHTHETADPRWSALAHLASPAQTEDPPTKGT